MPAGSVLFRNGRKRRMNMTKEELKQLPKVELHCHLDGSLSREFIEKRLGRQVSQEELTVSDDCTSLAEYLEKFDIPGRCLMDEQGLAEAGYDVLRSMSQENVCYAEIRFAPAVLRDRGYELQQSDRSTS